MEFICLLAIAIKLHRVMEAVQQKVAAVGDGGLLGRVCCLWRSIAARQCCSGKLSLWAWHWVGAAVCFRGPPASRLQPELWAVGCALSSHPQGGKVQCGTEWSFLLFVALFHSIRVLCPMWKSTLWNMS